METGDIITRSLSDVDELKMAIMLNFESVLPNFLTVIAVSGYLFWLYWPLATMALIGVPAFIYILVFFFSKAEAGHGSNSTSDRGHYSHPSRKCQ